MDRSQISRRNVILRATALANRFRNHRRNGRERAANRTVGVARIARRSLVN